MKFPSGDQVGSTSAAAAPLMAEGAPEITSLAWSPDGDYILLDDTQNHSPI